MPDTPSTRQSGLDYLKSQLEDGGVEVAEAGRYLGADLVAQVYQGSNVVARPIKVSSTKDPRFTLMSKSEKIPNVLLVYAWNTLSDSPELYALSYDEAFELLDSREHTKTDSWTVDGGYSLAVGSRWRQLLARYRMQPKDWKPTILGVSTTSPTTANVKEYLRRP